MSFDTMVPIQSDLLCYHNTTIPEDQSTSNLSYHRHNAYEIYFFLGGNVKLYIEHSCYQLVPGDLFLISPDQLHRSVCLDSTTYDRTIINLKEPVLRKLSSSRTDLSSCFHAGSAEYARHIHLNTTAKKQFLNLNGLLNFAMKQTEFGHDVLTNAYLTQLLVFINEHYYHSTSVKERNIMPELISRVMVYISEHLTEELTLSRLSQMFYLNGTYISSQFKHHTGLTLRTYILDQKITFARKLLLEGYSVSETCSLAGFSDYANFIRSFTNLTGISPGKYYKQYRNLH
ncbi:AraC family transcriptional regulator [Anaerocolumna sp. AGMB13020]|uniref:helix-turn-helix domain-containing protein n=1 Tax=Anaerocolumna sp. AGMB13020 TaxID=3081750 RepID=UPI002953F872|nr:AraC family transcriptional regulator [Anaerocolumna sp. AGMB13020]WOO38255.1 AraC family transcriptional regulator [Anaerocolumna sp. AGMB13020]